MRRSSHRSPNGDGRSQQRHDLQRRAVVDDEARERTARRLMVLRLRVQIARLEAQQPSDPRLAQTWQELRALTGAVQDADGPRGA